MNGLVMLDLQVMLDFATLDFTTLDLRVYEHEDEGIRDGDVD